MLTTKSLDAMPPATTKRYEVRDQKTNGLHVRVSTTGAKVFYTMVRPNGSRRRIKIGPYPVVSLADARRRAMEIARDVELGEFEKVPENSEAPTPTLTHLVQAGVDLPTVQRISGHKTLSMVARYAHQSGSHIEAAMDRLEGRVSSTHEDNIRTKQSHQREVLRNG